MNHWFPKIYCSQKLKDRQRHLWEAFLYKTILMERNNKVYNLQGVINLISSRFFSNDFLMSLNVVANYHYKRSRIIYTKLKALRVRYIFKTHSVIPAHTASSFFRYLFNPAQVNSSLRTRNQSEIKDGFTSYNDKISFVGVCKSRMYCFKDRPTGVIWMIDWTAVAGSILLHRCRLHFLVCLDTIILCILVRVVSKNGTTRKIQHAWRCPITKQL